MLQELAHKDILFVVNLDQQEPGSQLVHLQLNVADIEPLVDHCIQIIVLLIYQ